MNAPAESLDDPRPRFQRGRLWSLFDMMSAKAGAFLNMGGELALLRDKMVPGADGRLDFKAAGDHLWLKEALGRVADDCVTLGISSAAVHRRIKDPPQTIREFDQFVEDLRDDLQKKLLLLVPEDDAGLYEIAHLSDKARDAFPSASAELRLAGNAFVADLHVASMVHCSRAVEVGTRALAVKLEGEFPKGLENTQIQVVLDQCEKQYKKLGKVKGGADPKQLAYYGKALLNFWCFKDAVRVRVAHVHEPVTKAQARETLDNVIAFYDHIAVSGLREPGVSNGEPA